MAGLSVAGSRQGIGRAARRGSERRRVIMIVSEPLLVSKIYVARLTPHLPSSFTSSGIAELTTSSMSSCSLRARRSVSAKINRAGGSSTLMGQLALA